MLVSISQRGLLVSVAKPGHQDHVNFRTTIAEAKLRAEHFPVLELTNATREFVASLFKARSLCLNVIGGE